METKLARKSVHSVVMMATKVLDLLLLLLSSLTWLLPRRGRPLRSKPPHEMHPLAYLDGMRGICAYIIMTGHLTYNLKSWDWMPSPFLRIPWTQFPLRGGQASVLIFFWISGYTTTYKLVGLMQMKRSDQFLETLTSNTFRRYMRLFISPMPVVLIAAIAIKIGLITPPQAAYERISGNVLLFWLKDMSIMLNPFGPVSSYWTGESGSRLIEPTWSLGTEFRSNMITYSFCAATCRLSTKVRKRLILSILPTLLFWNVSSSFMAFLGMWYGETRQEKRLNQGSRSGRNIAPSSQRPVLMLNGHEIQEKNSDQLLLSSNTTDKHIHLVGNIGAGRYQSLKSVSLLLMFLYSFVMIQDPYELKNSKTFPHNLLNTLIPENWHNLAKMQINLAPGLMLMFWPLDQLTLLQRPLITPFAQYLGELSFGIYIVHKPVIWTVFEGRYFNWMARMYAPVPPDHLFRAIFPGWLMLAICVLWAAECFRKLDMQVPRFCVWLESRLFEKW